MYHAVLPSSRHAPHAEAAQDESGLAQPDHEDQRHLPPHAGLASNNGPRRDRVDIEYS
jgi:hypothetical protein